MGCGKRILTLCLLCFLGLPGIAQIKLTDSLEQKLKTTKDQQRVDLLNQLTYEFIAVDNTKAVSYNDEAIELSRKLSYIKGEAVAFTYRGVFESLSGQFPQARRHLHHGLSLSEKSGDRANKGYTLLQLGILGLETVENDSALFYFERAREIFKDSTNPTTLSKIYRNMSALYGQRYQYDKQEIYLDRAIAIRRLLSDRTLLVDALTLKATNKFTAGDLFTAEALLNEAEAVIKKHPEGEEDLNDIRHLRAIILFQKGHFDEAMILFNAARDYYLSKSHLRKYVTLLTDMGKVFSERGEYELALNHLYDALRFSQQHQFEAETFAIRNQVGWVNYHLGDMKQALSLANEGLNSDSKKQFRSDRANALTLKGVVHTELGELDSAKIYLDEALAAYIELHDDRGKSEAYLNLGFLESSRKNYLLAIQLYESSIQLAQETNYSFGLAWARWGVGDIYVKQGNHKAAMQYLNLSQEYCKLTHANELLIRNYNTRKDLLTAQTRYKEALEYSEMASQLKDSVHHTDLARRFVNLEKSQEIEERDRDILLLQRDKQLAEDKLQLQESKLQQQFILLVGGLGALILLAVLAFVYYRFYQRIKILNVTITDKNQRIQAQADTLQSVNVELQLLYKEVSEQNEKIRSQADKLVESNRNISDLNRSLEQIVAQKTLELRTTNEELVKYNNELLQFSYTVSHNLRGPVARLLGLSDLAQAEQNLAQAKRWVDLMHKTAGDLDLIIKDLNKILDLRNEPDQYLEPVDFEKEWQQSLSLLQDSLTGQEEITATFNLRGIMTVRAMVQSIFYNLLSNAIKFRSPDRNLKVHASSWTTDGKAYLEIKDNGLGFDTRLHKEKLFKLYKRFHSHVEGRGIGLYLIKAQLEVLHGTIDVESAPDQGSLFRITIPLVSDDTTKHAGINTILESAEVSKKVR
jgi:signal transduction histidine kinase